MAKQSRGNVGLRVSHDHIDITHTRQVRRWLFWKRWRTDLLATAPCVVNASDRVTLYQVGPDRFVAAVNGQTVLRYPQDPRMWAVAR